MLKRSGGPVRGLKREMGEFGVKNCYNCKKRELLCHSTCETYLAARKKIDDKRALGYDESKQYLMDKYYQFKKRYRKDW